ncbi:MAG: pseudouridine synthase [Verrucomicrobiae bacterium]|nr:pseudouridine synthase [Verrucomicrobiae bacterium]NNJ42624.1 pseudouridine synthase [Akkermansiaceae bacterium]
MRLDRFLYHHSPHGRRAIRPILAAGRVRVEGAIEKDSQCEIGDFTQVELDGVLLRADTPVYIMLNKPAGYLSATTDLQHPTVMELIDEPQTLHIAGRLDRATTGLLILTNDGKWSRQLTDPPHHKRDGVPKVYLVETAEPITQETHAHFTQGIYFAYEDLTTRPAELEILTPRQARLTLYEGRYHQIKRMFHAVGNRVTALHRLSVGKIQLDPELKPGQYRTLSEAEVRSISPVND